jgi:hypothetical protein
MSFRTLSLQDDVASIESAINEVISISGSIYTADANVKFFKNIASGSSTDLGGYWQTVYDASPTSSLSTPLFDVTYGYATGSSYNVTATASSSQTEKIKIYRQMASKLLGNADNIFTIGGVERKQAFFLLLKRNISKDEIKKGTVQLVIDSSAPAQYTASDQGAGVAFKQTIGGDYAPLKYNGTGSEVGLVFYNAGIVVIGSDTAFGAIASWSGSKTLIENQYSGSINNLVDGFRRKVQAVNLHNQTNLHSTVYFCRALNQEFNYSSNPTFVDDDKRIRVTSGSNILQTRTYVTTIGLYDANDNLLAVGKLNKPIVKSPDTESVFRLRLDY